MHVYSCLFFAVMQEMAHAQSKCEGEPLGGNLKFILPAITTTQMMESHCELQLAVEVNYPENLTCYDFDYLWKLLGAPDCAFNIVLVRYHHFGDPLVAVFAISGLSNPCVALLTNSASYQFPVSVI